MRQENLRTQLVSCQSIQVYLRYIQSLGLSDEALLEGHAFSPGVLRDVDARIDFETFRSISEKFSAMFPEDEDAAYHAGLAVPRLGSLGYIALLLAMRLDPGIVFSQTPRMVKRQFPMVDVHYMRETATRCRLTYSYHDGFEDFPEFEGVARGLMEATPCMAGFPPAHVELISKPRGFELDVSWSTRGKLIPRLNALTFKRLLHLRDAMKELEDAKDRVERQLQETQRASQRLEALLAIGRAVEHGLDIDDLIERFTKVAHSELGIRLLHLLLIGHPTDSRWAALSTETLEAIRGQSLARVMLPEPLADLSHPEDSVYAVSVEGQVGRIGLAFVSSKQDLLGRSELERALLLDAFGRLGRALGNALQHEELSTYGERLAKDVEARTAELQSTNNKLLDLNQAKKRFFTHLSHELRTPATLLSASLEQIESCISTQASIEPLLKQAQRNMARLVHAVDDLLDLALLDEAQMPKTYEAMNAGDLARAIVSAITPWAKVSGIEVELHTDPSDLNLVADRRLLEKGLLNLVANAVKFSEQGHIVRVLVEKTEEEAGVVFRVQDEGPGVAEEDRKKIFEAFEQADHQGLQQGIGIGLSLVRAIADLHGGSISHANRIPQGSEFMLWLPAIASGYRERRRQSFREPEGTAEERASSLLGRMSNAMPSALPPAEETNDETNDDANTETEVVFTLDEDRPTLLLVDDEPEILTLLSNHLSASYDVVTAKCGADALALVENRIPGAVLADVSMPGMSGFDLCRRLRMQPEMRSVPILLITALGSVDDKLQGFDAGADDYVTKPFSLREVDARLRAHLDNRRLAAEMSAMSNASLMGSVAAGIVHEINNPLNVLLNALPPVSDGLTSGGDAETARIMLDLAKDAARRIHDCVSSISSLASWSQGEIETADMFAFVSSVVRQYETRHGGTIQVSLQGSSSRLIGLRRTEAALIVGNLLANAMDAVGPGGKVEVLVEEHRDDVLVMIRDNGPGMDSEMIGKVWAPFYSTKTPGKGMGMGLFLVRQLLRHVGARLEVRSWVGKGTAMSVFFPFDWESSA